MRFAVRDGVRVDPPGSGCRFEPTRAPATVDEEILDRRQAKDGRGVRGDVDDAGPGPQHVGAAENREQLTGSCQLVLDHMRGTALRVRVVWIHAGSHDQLAFVRLADVDVDRVRHDNAVEDGL